MLKVLEGKLGMRLNRYSLLVLAGIFACGALFHVPVQAAGKDKDKQTKTTKVVVKAPKKPKTVRVTVTRSISLLFMMIRKGAATKVTSLLYLTPPTTAIMAWLLFDEPFTLLRGNFSHKTHVPVSSTSSCSTAIAASITAHRASSNHRSCRSARLESQFLHHELQGV